MKDSTKSVLKVAGAAAVGGAMGYLVSQGHMIDPGAPDAVQEAAKANLPNVGEAMRNTATVFGVGQAGFELGKRNQHFREGHKNARND